MAEAQGLEDMRIKAIDTVALQNSVKDLFVNKYGEDAKVPDIRNRDQVRIINFVNTIPDTISRTVSFQMDSTYMWIHFPKDPQLKESFYSYSYEMDKLYKKNIDQNIMAPYDRAVLQGARQIFIVEIFNNPLTIENFFFYRDRENIMRILYSKYLYAFKNVKGYLDYMFGSIEGYFNVSEERGKYFGNSFSVRFKENKKVLTWEETIEAVNMVIEDKKSKQQQMHFAN